MADIQKNPFELPPLAQNEVSEAYWLGTLPSCPHFNVSAGGVTFHRYTDPVVGFDRDSMSTQRSYNKGSVEYLTKSQVEAINRAVKDKVVRFFGTKGQGQIHAFASPSYMRDPKDQPLAMFIYLCPMNEASTSMRNRPGAEYPKSMYEVAGGLATPVVPAKLTGKEPEIAPEIEDLDKKPEFQHVPPQMSGKKGK